MSTRFEETLIRHCAATLAGHKCASLFSYRTQESESLEENLIDVSRLSRRRACASGFSSAAGRAR